MRKRRTSVRSLGTMPCLLGDAHEVEEPEEVVGDDKDTGCEEAERAERDQGPTGSEVLEVYDVTEDGECYMGQREVVVEVQCEM